MRPGPSSRAQSDTMPSIAYIVSQSVSSTPLTSTPASFEDEPLLEDTIQATGGTKKAIEVVTSQEYARRAEAELRAEQKMSSTQGQRHTRIQCASYAKEMLSNGFIRNHAMGITADDSGFRFQYYDRSKVVESQVSLLSLFQQLVVRGRKKRTYFVSGPPLFPPFSHNHTLTFSFMFTN